MKKMFMKIINISIVFAVALSSIVFLAKADYKSSLTVNLRDDNKKIIIKDADVSIYKVADFVTFFKHEYMPDERFVSVISELDFSSLDKTCTSENSKIIENYIKKNKIDTDKTIKTDYNGKAYFENVDLGIYLVVVSNTDKYSVDTFLIEVPLSENGVFTNEVNATPKIGIPTVPQNPDNPDKNNDDNNNGGKIPQTGQLKWPVPVMLISGITLIVLGYADYCQKKKRLLNDAQK